MGDSMGCGKTIGMEVRFCLVVKYIHRGWITNPVLRGHCNDLWLFMSYITLSLLLNISSSR